MKQDLERNRSTELGTVKINNEAITSIASTASMEIKGVHKMGGGIGPRLCEILLRKTFSKGVRVDTKDGDIKLTVSIIVDYGVDIPRIADEVQDNVKRAVEKMTGLVLSEVNVVIEGVHSQTKGGSHEVH